jgi:hypothetical protein
MHEECGVVQMDRGGGAGSSAYLSSAGALCIACPLHGLAGGELVPNPSIRYFLSTLLLVFADFFSAMFVTILFIRTIKNRGVLVYRIADEARRSNERWDTYSYYI